MRTQRFDDIRCVMMSMTALGALTLSFWMAGLLF